MSFFLSLAKGDLAARNMLKEAVIARYATRPMPCEALVLTLARQGRAFLGLPVAITTEVAYAEPDRWQRRETRRFFGLPLGTHTETLDGQSDPLLQESLRRQQWAFRALMLTPLTREGVTLTSVAERAFQAVHDDQPERVATLYLNPDYSLAAVEIERYRPSDKRRLPYMLRPEGGFQNIDNMNLPTQIAEQWGSESSTLYTVRGAQMVDKWQANT